MEARAALGGGELVVARGMASSRGASASPRSNALIGRKVPPHTMGRRPRVRTSAITSSASVAQRPASIGSSGSTTSTRWYGARARSAAVGLPEPRLKRR